MATVTGVTAARANAIEAASIVGASLQGNDLVFVTKGGTQINVGRIIPPLVNSYPVGSIYFTDRSANPTTYMGGGTWVRWGKGRVPVGIDEADPFFDAVEEQQGSKTYAMTPNEMPAHNHGGMTADQDRDHSHTGYTSTNGAHAHNYAAPAIGAGAVGTSNIYRQQQGAVTDVQGDHNHSVQTYGANQGHLHGIYTSGGSTPVQGNNLQPYITCYIWKRTA